MTDLFKQYDDFDFGDKQIKTVKENAIFCTTCAGSNLICDKTNGVIVCTDCGQVQDKQILVSDTNEIQSDNMPMRINYLLPKSNLKILSNTHDVMNKLIDSMPNIEDDTTDNYDTTDDYDSDCGSRCGSCGGKNIDIIKLEKKVQELTIELKKAHDDIARIKTDLMKIINY